MIQITDKKKCVGCWSCYNACPIRCISMVADKDGFAYPVVDTHKCINCSRCEKVCPVLNGHRDKRGAVTIYAAYARDEAIRSASSSGGVFTLLAEKVLNAGGTVFGAAFDDDFQVHHVQVKNGDGLSGLRGSKYVQSRIENTFAEAEALLRKNVPVLFSGTPCQIDALNNFLGKDYDHLITQDLVCHGVPAPSVWARYMDYIEGQIESRPQQITFRDKTHGWNRYSLKITGENGKISSHIFTEDLMMRAYLRDICLRPSCYACPSKGVKRSSDITLSDFWGIQYVAPELDDNRGIGLVICHTEKGEEQIESILPRLVYREADQSAIIYNQAMVKSAVKDRRYELFMDEIQKKPFDLIVKKYCTPSIVERAIRKSKAIIKN